MKFIKQKKETASINDKKIEKSFLFHCFALMSKLALGIIHSISVVITGGVSHKTMEFIIHDISIRIESFFTILAEIRANRLIKKHIQALENIKAIRNWIQLNNYQYNPNLRLGITTRCHNWFRYKICGINLIHPLAYHNASLQKNLVRFHKLKTMLYGNVSNKDLHYFVREEFNKYKYILPLINSNDNIRHSPTFFRKKDMIQFSVEKSKKLLHEFGASPEIQNISTLLKAVNSNHQARDDFHSLENFFNLKENY